jgi:alpha-glucoside transport system permease protein
LSWLNDLAHSSGAGGKLGFAVLVVAAFLAVIGLLLLLIDRTPKRGQERYQAFLFLLPAIILLAIGLVGPIITTAISSVTTPEVRLKHCIPTATNNCLASKGGAFDNFANYRWAFTNSEVLNALWNTIKWTLIAPITATAIGLVYANVVDKIRGEAIAKALIFLPGAISFVGAAVIWGLIYKQPSQNAPSGLLNVVLKWFGAGPINFGQDAHTTTYFLIIIMIWIQAGFATVILSAAIKGVPTEMLEAARLDGANAVQIFFRVVIPSIRPSIIVVLVTISVATLKVFDLVQAFGADKFGGNTLANLMYTTWKQAPIGSAGGALGEHRSATLAMIIFLLVIPFVGYQVRQMVKARAGR